MSVPIATKAGLPPEMSSLDKPTTVIDILLVDDEPSIRLSIGEALRSAGYRVVVAADGGEALEAIAGKVFDVVVCDVRLPRVNGLKVLHALRTKSPETDVIMMTAFGAVSDAVAAMKEGAADYLTKPFELDELLLRIDRLARERTLKRDLDQARAFIRHTGEQAQVGRSPVMQRMFERIERFALADAPILITGESGTGKELVAAALHQRSSRRDKPFVAVNCAAFPETLLEAELFGHERGAFTGAVRKRDGRFKAADGGTLLLDEVAEIPLPAQAKLLRVLQEQSFEPLGTNQAVRVDVRVLSATHRDLKDLVARKLFRSDLYYRLKILELSVPPLRERYGDLPVLIEHFLRRASGQGEPLGITSRAMAALADHPFPGNVRELEHAIQHAVALSGGQGDIDLIHLPHDVVGQGVIPEPEQSGLRPLSSAVREFEREYLRRALRAGGGSKGRTATMLGISRKNLWEKLKRHALVDSADEEVTTGSHPIPPLADPAGEVDALAPEPSGQGGK